MRYIVQAGEQFVYETPEYWDFTNLRTKAMLYPTARLATESACEVLKRNPEAVIIIHPVK